VLLLEVINSPGYQDTAWVAQMSDSGKLTLMVADAGRISGESWREA